MKIFSLIASAHAASEILGTEHLCKSLNNGVSNHIKNVTDTVTLEPNESCVYRFLGSETEVIEFLTAKLDLECDQGEMWLLSNGEQMGPFCRSTGRHRRANGYNMNMGDLTGKNFNSDEVDVVFQNGQGFRFSFGFQFEFEFLPGLPGGNDMCSYKTIQESNSRFGNSADGNDAALALWVELTASMYYFNCYYSEYTGQCKNFSPVRVSCNTMDWSASCEQMAVQIKAIINSQCTQCTFDGICAKWNELWNQLKNAIDGGASYGPNPTPGCDVDQCTGGNSYGSGSVCPSNSSCENLCAGYKCNCDDGYTMTDDVCVKDCDENQCAAAYDVNPCGHNAICTDKCDGYKCICEEGYTMNNDVCVKDCDENQCDVANALNPCGENAICSDRCDGYKCSCEKNYHMEDDKCVPDCDENQCDNSPCDPRETCTNKCDGYSCDCDSGYSGDDCCEVENKCSDASSCPAHSTCEKECVGYKCNCDDGYHKDGDECVPTCDENQCALPFGGGYPCDAREVCIDLCSGYKCECDVGYSGRKCCEMENVCNTNPDVCPANSQCKKQCVGHTCDCDEGYTMVNGECKPDCDADQCSNDEAYCKDNSICNNLCNGYECICKDGYSENNKDECCDKNQCREKNACPAYSICHDKCTGHKCECWPGFSMVDDACVKDCDTNQCDQNPCGPYSTCTMNCPGYDCGCINGYEMVNEVCTKICDENQCDVGSYGVNSCGPNSICVDKCQGYGCKCEEGYSMVNKKCVKDCDENQCTRSGYGVTPACEKNMKCTNLCQGFECECLPNYIPDPIDGGCVHTDECYDVKCGKHQVCKDGDCVCKNGYYNNVNPYTGNGVCEEKVNECIMGTHNCASYADCTDTYQSFTCECHDTYKDTSENGDGTVCVHPYYTETGECNLREYSSFTDAKFTKIAYTTSYNYFDAIENWKAITAELSRLGEISHRERFASCDDMAGIVGCKLIDYTKDPTACDWAHTLETVVTEVALLCNAPWHVKFKDHLDALRKASCDEPNDCESGINNCDENAECIPKPAMYGSATSGFTCKCKNGYYGNGKTCFVLVDECSEGSHKCSNYADCSDTKNGYTCTCMHGYVGNGYKCSIPVNECKDGTHDCDYHANCKDLDNGYMCVCDAKQGYTGNGKECTGPADECLDQTNTCHNDATCTNTYASYTCTCPTGWFGDGKKCWPPLTCPWTSDDYDNYAGDFPNGQCSLKYTKICTNTLYADMTAAGMKFCQGSYAQQQFNILMNELFALGKTYERKFGIATSHITGDNYNRYGAECAVEAGAVPCHLINFHNIVSVQDLFDRVQALFDHVFGQCSPVYKAQWEQWLARYHNALICPVNECITGDYVCNENAVCKDMAMGYDCVCKKHYSGDGFTNCDMIDYCADNTICPMYAECSNTYPGYKCDCMPGYYKHGSKCVQENPCKTNNGNCNEYAICRSQLVGSTYNHYCTCKPGYFGDGFSCAPIDPCEYNNCHVNGKCVPYNNVLTSADYNCVCNEGYKGNGFVCEEYKDICDGVTCDDNAHTKQVTVYGTTTCKCECDSGFSGNGHTCIPDSACSGNDCSKDAVCSSNPYTGFTCTCKEGYTGDGRQCNKEDPCDECHQHATCTGGSLCKCKKEYVGDGFTCRPANKCSSSCPPGTNCVDGDCICQNTGYAYNFKSYKCEDINECKKERHNCHQNAICENTNGGFRCKCKSGFTGDGVSCRQTDTTDPYDNGNQYVNQQDSASVEPLPTGRPDKTGLDIDIYADLGDGQCALMGFDWENEAKLMYKFKWGYDKSTAQKYITNIFAQFSTLGKSAALARAGPSCDEKLAGKVPCKLLYFPHTEHRCQLVKRMASIFADVTQHCNAAWKNIYGPQMNWLLRWNQKGKQDGVCDAVRWL